MTVARDSQNGAYPDAEVAAEVAENVTGEEITLEKSEGSEE